MKKLVLLLIPFILSSCQSNTESRISDYLKSKNVTEFSFIEIGKVDSIFTPFDLELFYSVQKSMLRKDITDYECKELEAKIYHPHNKPLIKSYHDSIQLFKDSLHNKTMQYYDVLKQREPNRLGVDAKIKYKMLNGLYKTANYTFVFNQDGKTIGHHLDIFGHVCE